MMGTVVQRLGRLGVRLWGPFLLLALVSLVVGSVALYTTYTDQRRYVVSLQEEVAARTSLYVSDHLQSIENSLIARAQTLSFAGDDPIAQQHYLRSLLEANPAFFELALIDLDGQETAKAARDRPAADQNLLDQSNTKKFLTASQGQNYVGSVYISEFGVPFYTLAVPVYDDTSRLVGVLAAEANADEMWNVVDRILVGQAGYVYLVDGMGNLIAYRDLELVMQRPDVSQQVVGVQRFLAGDFQVVEYQGLDGQPVIGARQRINGTDWGVIAELPAREAYHTANLFALTSALVFLVVVVVALAMGWFITRRVVQPLVALCEGAAILGRGNLDYRIQVDARGEIGELAAEFNAMAASLQQSQAETQARLREVSSLVEAGRAITSLDLQRVLNTLAKEAARAVQAQVCVIYILNELSLTLEPKSAWSQPGFECDPPPQPVGEGVAGWIAKHAQTLCLEDVHADPRFADQKVIFPHRTLMGLPMMVSGRLVGALLVSGKLNGEQSFTSSDERLLQAFADQAAVTIENAELYGEERRRSRELALVNRISRTITASLDLETTLDAILASVRDLLPYVAAEICLWEPEKKQLFPGGWGGDLSYRHLDAGLYALDEGYTGWIARHQKPLFISDISAFDEVKPKLASAQVLAGSYIGVPLMVGDTFVGTLELISHEASPYKLQDLDTLQTVANQAAVAIENARLYHQEQRRLREAEGMLRVTGVLSSSQSLREALDEAAHQISALFDAYRVAFVLFNNDQTMVQSVVGLPLDQTDLVYENYRLLTHIFESEQLATKRAPLIDQCLFCIEDWDALDTIPGQQSDPRVIRHIFPDTRSLLLLPLSTSKRLGGAMALQWLEPRRFAEDEINLAIAIAQQAAVAVEKTRLLEEARHAAEVQAGVARIAHIAVSTLDLDELISRTMAEAIRLVDAEKGALLLWDRGREELIAHPSGAVGVAPQEVADFRIKADDPAFEESVLSQGRPFISDNASHDRRILEAYRPFVQRFDVKTLLAVPLTLQEQSIGELYAVNKATPFTQEDIRFMTAIAAYMAAAIQNARLFAATERNMREVSILYQTTSALSPKLSVDELLNDLEQRISLALEADECAISEWDEAGGILRTRERRPYLVADFPATAEVLRSQQPKTVIVSDPGADPAEVTLLRQLGYRSLLMLPLLMRDAVTGLVEIFDAKERYFAHEEIRLAQALASQAAIALQNAQLFSLTDERLHKRIKELSGLQRVSQELNSTLDQDRILQLVLEEAVRATGADFGNVSLHDRSSGKLLAYANFGFDDEEMARLKEGEFYIGTGVMGRALQTGEPVLVPDVSLDPDYVMASSESRSEVAVPIFYAGDVAGVINLESRQLNAFSEEQLQYLQALANQAAVATRNALAYEEQRQQRELLRQRAEQLARLSEISHAFRSDQPLESVLEDIAYAIQETLGFNVVLISVMRGDLPMLHRVAGAGIPLVELERLKATPQSPEVVMDLIQDRFRLGLQSYYVPHTYKELWEDRLDAHYTQPEYLPEADEQCWDVDDLCFSPLYNSALQLIGVISVDNPRDGRLPTRQVMETLELFANQAAAAIENAYLFRSEQERRRLADTLREVAAVVNSTLSVDQVIEAILDQLRHVVPYDSATVQVLSGDHLIITGGRGWDNIQDVLGLAFPVAGDNPNAVVVRTRAPYIVPHTQAAHAAFREPPHNHIRSWLGIPLLFGDNLLGMIALDSVDPDHYTQEHAQLALTFANQVAVALQNAQLFEQARQYADQLRVINEVGVEITSILNVDQLIARISQLVEDNFNYYANIGLIEDEYLVLRGRGDHGNGEGRRNVYSETYRLRVGEEGITGWVAASGQTMVVPDITQDPHYLAGPQHARSLDKGITRSEVAIPLRVQDRIIGVFDVQSDAPEGFTENDVLVLQSLANQVAVAIANAQLFEHVSQLGQELEQRVQERTEALAKTLEDLTLERDRVETLYRITRELSASLDLDRVLAEALSLINRAVGVSHGSIMLLDSGTGNLIYRAALGRSKGLPRGGILTRYRRGVGLAGWVLETRESVIVPDVTQDPRWIPDEKKPTPERKSAIAVPLTAGEDVLGVLLLFHPEVGYFMPDHLKLVSAAAIQVATAINNAELYQLITDQAERLGLMLRTQRAEAAKHQAIVEGIADGVLVLDANRYVVLMNPAAAHILGVKDASAVEGQHIREILKQAESPMNQVLARQLYDKLMTGIEHFSILEPSQDSPVSGLGFRLEAEEKVIVVNLSPVSLGSGELPSLVTVLRDVSREAEVERLKNEFISTVSHELRTPMTSIKGYTDLLVSEKVGTLSEQQRRFVHVIKSNADRLTALVNDILDISRIETGRIRLKITSIDLAKLIDDVADNFQGRMVEKSLDLTLDLPSEIPPVRGDEARVIQILENLTSNAWKYTPEGGEVTVRARVVDGFVQVDVADTGIGIAQRDLAHIFDRFYRTEQAEVRAVDGTGLGLAIVKMFVELLGGKIWVKSKVNRGSTFSFTLPLAVETPVGSSNGDTTAPKILVVDDDEHILQLLRHHLETEGYQVLTAQRGEDVFELAYSEQPALITLDIILADMDGFEVLEKLKKEPVTAGIPVIIVSVVPDAETRGLALGAAGYIGKPFEELQVLNQVRKVLASLGITENGRLNHVLVVDDDRHIVDWLKEALTSSGFVVQGAYNGHEALALAREDSPDLILLDLKMPDMDGYEVIRNLRREQATRSIPVIVITGSSFDDDYDHVEILGMGVEHMLTKPFTVATLVEEIKRVGHGAVD
jgi:GAF domain-containing protein/DNA-binding response OmpR family regulator/nitrogen-specific signal transduction histidine kinase/HAMP domain-containing protein